MKALLDLDNYEKKSYKSDLEFMQLEQATTHDGKSSVSNRFMKKDNLLNHPR